MTKVTEVWIFPTGVKKPGWNGASPEKRGIVVSWDTALRLSILPWTEPFAFQAVEQHMEPKKQDSKKPARPNFNFYWVYAGIGALLIAMILSGSSSPAGHVSFQQLISKAEKAN